MSTGFISRNTVTGARSVAPTAVKAAASSAMSMKKALSSFRMRWANVTTRAHVGIIIRRGSISGTIPMCCLNRTAAEQIVVPCQGLPSVKRPIPFPLLSQPMWSGEACCTMSSTPCIATSARRSARRRLSVCSGYTASAPHPNGAALPSSGRQTGRDRYGLVRSCCTIPLPGIG